MQGQNFLSLDIVIETQLFWHMVWFIYHPYSILREINLRQKETSAHSTVSMSHIPPIPLSKLHLGFHYCFCSAFKMFVSGPNILWVFLQQLTTPLSWSSELIFQSIVAFWSSGSQPYKSSSRIQGKKSPFQLPAFATVFECMCGGYFSFSPLLHFQHLFRRNCRPVQNSHENHSGNSQFPTGSLLENFKAFFQTLFPVKYILMIFFAPKIIFWFFFLIIWAEQLIW